MTEINDFVLEEFYKIITPNKVEMFDRIAADRTKHLTVALENIYQEHNASAVLRSCDCFGLQQLFYHFVIILPFFATLKFSHFEIFAI